MVYWPHGMEVDSEIALVNKIQHMVSDQVRSHHRSHIRSFVHHYLDIKTMRKALPLIAFEQPFFSVTRSLSLNYMAAEIDFLY